MNGPTVDDTKQRILMAARTIFAEFGFRDGTIRDIVARARVNQAAVNYHFQNKEGLYREVLRSALVGMENPAPLVQSPSATAPPEEQLKQLIRSLISATERHDDVSQTSKLLAWEFIYPTGYLESVKHRVLAPHLEAVSRIVRELLPHQASQWTISIAAFWLLGQCLMFHRGSDLRAHEYFDHAALPPTDLKFHTVELITELALKGLTGAGRNQ